MKVWHQAVSDITELPAYARILDEHARRILPPDVKVDLHGAKPGSYSHGLLPVQTGKFRWWHHLVAIQIVEAAREAEAQGYDVFASTCFLDPGLDEARSVVDIPVLSACETALLVASTIGRRFAFITIDPAFARTLQEMIRRYGFDGRVFAVETMDPPLSEPELEPIFAGSDEFVARFAKQATRFVAAGADVIIPAEGVLNMALVRNNVINIEGVPVLDSYGALLLTAQMAVSLRRRTGLSVSRAGTYARPNHAIISHIGKLTAEILMKR